MDVSKSRRYAGQSEYGIINQMGHLQAGLERAIYQRLSVEKYFELSVTFIYFSNKRLIIVHYITS